jgi:HJR/Mrr/RecB family endonuclease
MDFGFDKILLELLKGNWLLIGLVVLGLILFKLFFDDVLPYVANRLRSKILFDQSKRWKDDRELIQQLTLMTPSDFEHYVAEVFRKLGYRAERIGGTGDHGLDIEI